MNENTTSFPAASTLVGLFGSPKKSLGQCFLTDPSILKRLLSFSGAAAGDPIFEVGPGPGTLTRTLIEEGHRVLALELDRRAVHHLNTHLNHPDLEVVQGDALKVDLKALLTRDRVPLRHAIGNLPYNVATEIFFRMEKLSCLENMTFMFQKEVANRFVGIEGSTNYGPLALLSRIRWQPEIVMTLPPGAFFPRPRVHSAVVRFKKRTTPLVSQDLEPVFRIIVKTAFQQRRKKIRNAVSELASEEMIVRAEIDPGLRPERLSMNAFIELSRQVSSVSTQETH